MGVRLTRMPCPVQQVAHTAAWPHGRVSCQRRRGRRTRRSSPIDQPAMTCGLVRLLDTGRLGIAPLGPQLPTRAVCTALETPCLAEKGAGHKAPLTTAPGTGRVQWEPLVSVSR